jgi:hypothetical protein
MAAGDQLLLPPSVASFAIDHPSGQVIFFSIRTAIGWFPSGCQQVAHNEVHLVTTAAAEMTAWDLTLAGSLPGGALL